MSQYNIVYEKNIMIGKFHHTTIKNNKMKCIPFHEKYIKHGCAHYCLHPNLNFPNKQRKSVAKQQLLTGAKVIA